LSRRGEVVGLVVGKANAIRIAQITGDVPQNVNFAISGRTLAAFLDANSIKYSKANATIQLLRPTKELSDVADMARGSSAKVECYR
jgi:hypothetical protein